ncbi:Serine/threonine-protein kinase plo1 [Smittium mucronatum]|uniref:Serine/threonine-protein kinase n=1 Tax=Smittium mucronatum TaxID=133383 RepID=A0A1R0H500_9FUNG|nr:Serine/threonine-protein kinase plo1 [Smittium mucronatum]
MAERSEFFINPDGSKIHKIISDPSSPSNLYEIIEVLGVGSFGKCYRVKDLNDEGQEWACKVLEKSSITTPKIKERIQFEVSIIQSLPKHQRIAYGHKVFQDQTKIYIIMELCSKYTMETLIRQRKRLSEFEARYFFIQAVEGIVELHRRRIIHRDIKLANILLNEKNQVKIGDFGLSALLESRADRKTSFLGTLNYLSPEVVLRAKKGHSFGVDVWALGVYLYAMLVGKTPFAPKQKPAKPEHYYREICQGKIDFPPELNISDEAKDLILQLCQRPEEKRIKTNQIKYHPWILNHISTIPETMPDAIFSSQIDPIKWNKFIESQINKKIELQSEINFYDHSKDQRPRSIVSKNSSNSNFVEENHKPHISKSTTNSVIHVHSHSDRGSEVPDRSDFRSNNFNSSNTNLSPNKKPALRISKLRDSNAAELNFEDSRSTKPLTPIEPHALANGLETTRGSNMGVSNNNGRNHEHRLKSSQKSNPDLENSRAISSSSKPVLDKKLSQDNLANLENKMIENVTEETKNIITKDPNSNVSPNTLTNLNGKAENNEENENIEPQGSNSPENAVYDDDHLIREKKKIDINSLFKVWQAKLEVLSHRFNFYLKEATSNKLAKNHGEPNYDQNEIKVRMPIHLTRFVRVPKYGLGYELSNGTFGVSFRDKTSILCLKDTENPLIIIANKSRVEIKQLPQMDQIKGLEQKIALYSQFKVAVNEQPLTKHAQKYVNTSNIETPSPYVFVTKYLSATNVSMYRISNGAIQVIFKDGTQLLLFDEDKITFTDKSVRSVTFDIKDSSDNVFNKTTFNHNELVNRINYTSKILEAVT